MEKLAVIFPGQGSQTVGMLADIANEFSEIMPIFSRASDVLHYDLWKLVQEGPAEELDKTVHTQPALLAASYAIWTILQKYSKNPFDVHLMAGHSLGEYSALVCADAFSFETGIELVAARGRYMQEAVPVGQGALAAIIGLEDELVKTICNEAVQSNEVLSPANFNSPGQIVIAGNKGSVERAVVLAKEKGARLAKLLPVSVPSHCALMLPAAEKLQDTLASITIKNPTRSVINNVDVKIYQSPDDIRKGLMQQLYMPVRWIEVIKKMVDEGASSLLECGAGKVLSSLNKRMVELPLNDTSNLDSLKKFLA